MQYTGDNTTIPPLRSFFPDQLWDMLRQISKQRGIELYISGGTVRDWLLGKKPADLDITVSSGAEDCCRQLIALLGASRWGRAVPPHE